MEHGGMVIAHELKAYSDVIAAALGVLRPQLPVTIVTPGELDGAVTAAAPHLVLASSAPQALPPHVQTWIELYPGGSNHAVIHQGSEQRTIRDIDFATLLALLDEALAGEPTPPPTPVRPATPAA